MTTPDRSENPFIRYRWMLDSYRLAHEAGWSDADFVSLVERIDDAVAAVDGHGFTVTPIAPQPDLASALGLDPRRLWVKDETGNVSGSHKARHLFGVMLHQAIETDDSRELAIASCGNAALAAAVVARAADKPLRVFIPTWADAAVVRDLERLEARIEVCDRRPDEVGDPTYLRFTEAVSAGSEPFSCQSTATPSTIDGGRTIGWELAEQLGAAGVEGRLSLFVQVGGGALAAAAWQGLMEGVREQWLLATPRLWPVQTTSCAPLDRAWRRLHAETAAEPEDYLALAGENPGRYMTAWEDVGSSAASGILDDVTYDWLPIVEAMLINGGTPVVVTEDQVVEAHRLAHEHTAIDVDATGTAGMAGLLDRTTLASIGQDEHVAVLFTGHTRR